MENKRAPGPNCIPAEVYKPAFHYGSELLLDAFNACMKERFPFFSFDRKVVRLELINKGKGYSELPLAYRPLCMLDIIENGSEFGLITGDLRHQDLS